MSGGGGNSGGGGGGSSVPANTTAVNTYIQDLPNWEQQYMSSLLGQTQAVSSRPYQQFPGQQVADFTPDQTAAFGNIENLVNSNAAGNIQNAGVGAAMQGANTAQGISAAGSPYYQASTDVGSPQGIQTYMSPFLNNQITGLENVAQQNWNQFTAPSVNNAFISAGQSGSGRNEEVLGQQANLASQALAGQVANAEQNAFATAGQQAGQEASILQGAGSGLGNLANTQAGTQANIGTQLGNLGNQVQTTGIAGAAALQDVGQQQQQLAQQNINVAQQNWQNQFMWPQQQLSWESNILHGLPSTTGTTATNTSPMTNNVVGSVSPLSALGGALIGTGGLAGINGSSNTGASAKRGGLIKGYADGGPVINEDEAAQIQAEIGALPPSDSGINLDVPADGGGIQNPLASLAPIPPPPLPPAPPPQTTSQPEPTRGLFGEKSPVTPLSGIRPISLDPEQMRGYQLLAMAKGFLTPAHSGAEALGNALGNYGETGMEQAKWTAEMNQKYLPIMQKQEELGLEKERIEQGKYQPFKDAYGNLLGVMNTKTGQIENPIGTTSGMPTTTPTGQPLTKDVVDIDRKVLDNMNKTFDPKQIQTSDQVTKNMMEILSRNNLNTQSQSISEANKWIPGPDLPGAIPPDDYAQLKSGMGTLKAAAMQNSKNIRNQREFNAITSPANLLGGGNVSAQAQVQMLNAAAKEPYAENEFFNQYYEKYHTLSGSREVWRAYQSDNDPIMRDEKQNPTGVNDAYFDPGNIKKYVDNAPQIYQKITSGGGAPSAAAPAQRQQQGSGNVPKGPSERIATQADIQAAAQKTGKSVEQVTKDAIAKGYKVQ